MKRRPAGRESGPPGGRLEPAFLQAVGLPRRGPPGTPALRRALRRLDVRRPGPRPGPAARTRHGHRRPRHPLHSIRAAASPRPRGLRRPRHHRHRPLGLAARPGLLPAHGEMAPAGHAEFAARGQELSVRMRILLSFLISASACTGGRELGQSSGPSDATSDQATVVAFAGGREDAMPADASSSVGQDGSSFDADVEAAEARAAWGQADCPPGVSPPDAAIPDAEVYLCDPLPPGSVGCAASPDPEAAVYPVGCVAELPNASPACPYCCGPELCYCEENLRLQDAAPVTYALICPI